MDPELLPRQKLMSLCLTVIGTMELDLQQKASTALLKLAACANGDEGAATATSAEVLELLKALESPCSAVREASLQVRLLLLLTVQPSGGINFTCAAKCRRWGSGLGWGGGGPFLFVFSMSEKLLPTLLCLSKYCVNWIWYKTDLLI